MYAQKGIRTTLDWKPDTKKIQSPPNSHSLELGETIKKSMFINGMGGYKVGRIISLKKKCINIKVSVLRLT